jgi:uncharacterized protein YjbI with pentapeptide repeats
MANEAHLAILKQGVQTWNEWRKAHPEVTPDLTECHLAKADLENVNFRTTYLNGTDLSQANLKNANLSPAGLSTVKFTGANLSGARLQESDLRGVDFSGACLSKANLRGANLSEARFKGTLIRAADFTRASLNNADFRGVQVIGNPPEGRSILAVISLRPIFPGAFLTEANFSQVDLNGVNFIMADLSRADFTEANLSSTQLLHTNLSGAKLTGACIENWQISSSTVLDDVKCDYIFRSYDSENRQFSGRLPVKSEDTFAPGEFEAWLEVNKGMLDTIDITFSGGIDWQSLSDSLQRVRQQHPVAQIGVQAIQEHRGYFVVSFRVESEVAEEVLQQLRGDIEREFKLYYMERLAEAHGAIRALECSLDKALEKLAMASGDSSTHLNFYGPTGNVAGTNYGSMTAHINQNSDEIARLLMSLREKAQTFPQEQKEEALMEIDDLESDLQTPEKQDPKRIGKRLKRLIAAGTAAVAISGSVATASGHLNEFATNVLELGEKIGLMQEKIQLPEEH